MLQLDDTRTNYGEPHGKLTDDFAVRLGSLRRTARSRQ